MKNSLALTFLVIAVSLWSFAACKSGDPVSPPAASVTPQTQPTALPQNSPVSAPSIIARAEPAPTIAANPIDRSFSDVTMLYSKFFTARVKSIDRDTVSSLLTDDYSETTGEGKVQNKADVLATVRPNRRADTFSLDNIQSSESGNISTLRGSASVTRKDQKESWQFVVTLRKEQGKWLVASTRISDYKVTKP